MDADPKPYLEYLDKEMTIMGLLSAFSITLAAVVTDRIVTAKHGFLNDVWMHGKYHIIAAGVLAVVAALLFYLQRSLLAWYYGQICLAQVRGPTSPRTLKAWLKDADGWDTWARYQGGFIALVGAALCYAYAVVEGLSDEELSGPFYWPLWLLLVIVVAIFLWRRHVLNAYPQEDKPGKAWWNSLINRLHNC